MLDVREEINGSLVEFVERLRHVFWFRWWWWWFVERCCDFNSHNKRANQTWCGSTIIIISDCWGAYIFQLMIFQKVIITKLSIILSILLIQLQEHMYIHKQSKQRGTQQSYEINDSSERIIMMKMLDSYFCKFMWRQRIKHQEDPFIEILKDISNFDLEEL
eukprot:Pompholyxophrys_punicea_v1_NODE_692_length_1452_cov_33.509664.p1 type:complete len:161 gc:universal NODE_692_length_1452_cov_33.509664:782-1264(+)